MTTSRGNNAGGRANEGGSSYRAGLAAYLAAHGLAGLEVQIADSASPGTPTLMWFETSAHVDDIRCRFAEDSRWDIQAKRRCSWDGRFRSVVEQWVQAVRAEALGDKDWVVLASGGLSDRLKSLGAALRRLREPSEGELLPDENRQYEQLRELASSGGWFDVFDQVVAHAMIIDINAETGSDSAFREAAALLDGTVVARGAGVAAMNALARFFQTEAARAGASGPERWLRVLDDAKVAPGPVSAHASAGSARALATYRAGLANRRDLLDVDHLAVGVPPMPIPNLLNTFRVQLPDSGDPRGSDTAQLAHVACRWPRFTVVGLPGSGKTTAMEQLAASWAVDLDAPIPLLVRLHRLVAPLRDRQRVGLEETVRAADGVSDQLVPLLVERLKDGTAALLLDGLDECRDQQGAAINLILRLTDELHPETGLVVSTRDAASDLAKRTGLPLTILQEPNHLSSHVLKLVDHVSKVVRSDSGDDRALALAWVEDSQTTHPDIWRIPLFAVLLAVHAARTPGDRLPASRASALVSAIKDSVAQWEVQKAQAPGAWHPDLHPDLLLDGFADIGHAITTGNTDLADATTAVSQTVTEWWGEAPARAEAVAGDILRWWIDRVGAFAVVEGLLYARVRMMGEIGDAMWAARQTPKRRSQWLDHVVADGARLRESALLAAELEPAVIDEIINAANDSDAVLLAADAVLQGAAPSDGTLGLLVENLARLASNPPPVTEESATAGTAAAMFARLDERQQQRDGPEWRYLHPLAGLPVPPSHRQFREEALAQIDDDERLTVATALAVAADCAYDEREPTDTERLILERLLALPVPESEPVEYRRSRRHTMIGATEPILSGRPEAVVSAIRLVGLTADTAPAAVRLAECASASVGETLISGIRGAGFAHEVTKRPMSRVFESMQKFFRDDPGLDIRFVLEAATSMLPTVRSTTPVRAYRLAAAASLLEVLESGKQASGTEDRAVEHHPDLVRHAVRMAVPATGHTTERIANECQRALNLLDTDPLDTAVLLRRPPDPLRSISPASPAVTRKDHAVLRRCLKSGNDWLFWLAAKWLAEVGERGVKVLWRELPYMPAFHRGAIAGWVAEAMQQPEAYAEWLTGNDPILRVVAASCLATAGVDQATILTLAGDADLNVRIAILRALTKANHADLLEMALVEALDTPPSVWTCPWCGSIEAITTWDCTSCTVGDRKDLEEEVRRLRK